MARDDDETPKVVDLTQWLSFKYGHRACSHNHVVVDAAAKIVICKDCDREISAMDALINYAHQTNRLSKEYRAAAEEVQKLKRWNPFLRAVRELESIWRGKMLPMCPHCRKGITAEALVHSGLVSKPFAVTEGGKDGV